VRGLFVTGTDSGVGKSIVAASICAALAARGERVAAFKPVVTGLDEPAGGFPADHELLAAAAGGRQSPADVAPYRYGPPLSPHFAAQLAGETIEPARLTINHTLLTVEAGRAVGLEVAAIVMTPWPAEPSPMELSNRETVERLAGAPVSGLPDVDPGPLAVAGAELPLDRWL
jgi:dethiobiotin synthetase